MYGPQSKFGINEQDQMAGHHNVLSCRGPLRNGCLIALIPIATQLGIYDILLGDPKKAFEGNTPECLSDIVV